MDDSHPSSLRLETLSNADRTVIVVLGDLDAATAPQLQAVVDALGEDVRTIELDFTDLGFFDSSGVSILVRALRRLEQVDGRLGLRGASESVLRVLRITDLLRFVDLVDD